MGTRQKNQVKNSRKRDTKQTQLIRVNEHVKKFILVSDYTTINSEKGFLLHIHNFIGSGFLGQVSSSNSIFYINNNTTNVQNCVIIHHVVSMNPY